jgi:hypothetical protein
MHGAYYLWGIRLLYVMFLARGSVVVKATSYNPEGCGFEIRWSEWLLSIHLILLAALGPEVYSASSRNDYRKHKLRLTTLPPSMSWLSRQCEILKLSQHYRPPRPDTGRVFHFYFLLYVRTLTVLPGCLSLADNYYLPNFSSRISFSILLPPRKLRVWGSELLSLSMKNSACSVRLPTDVISLQLCTSKVVGVYIYLLNCNWVLNRRQ